MELNGILNILKPPVMTSFDVVAYLRHQLHIKKIGHTGTLDPGAVGVLPVCLGSATKAIEYLTEKDKLYRAELTLGIATDTQDSFGKVLSAQEAVTDESRIREVIGGFIGRILQVPPMYSSVKVGGVRLYELARSGVTVEREAREIEIYAIKVIDIRRQKCENALPEMPDTLVKVLFDVHCSKGTYIRTLCADIGSRLGCGGHMSFLVRLRSGIFDISKAYTLEDMSGLIRRNAVHACLEKVEGIFADLKKIVLDRKDEKKFLNGVPIEIDEGGFSSGDLTRVYDDEGKFLALGEMINRQNGGIALKSKKFF